MSRQFMRNIKNMQISKEMNVQGLLNIDCEALSPCQKECVQRLSHTIQLEQESYLNEHPEIFTILKLFMMKAAQPPKNHNIYADTAQYFTRPISVLVQEINELLNLPDGSYLDQKKKFTYRDMSMEEDIWNITVKHYPWKGEEATLSEAETHFTTSSSFLSDHTSSSTLPTPESVATPVPTTSEIFFKMVCDTLNKATFSGVTDEQLRYDTAYVELMKAVERAMEIPVIEIRQDIEKLFNTAYYNFDLIIRERERIEAEIAWEKRMRKKLKRSLRRQRNFKGYETPPTPKSVISSHESYLVAPPRPCHCYPEGTYNRYPKDRFGIYLPRTVQFKNHNITDTPAIFIQSVDEENDTITNKKTKKKIKNKIK